MTDKPGNSIDKTDDSQSSWATQIWKNLELQALNKPAQTEGPREASSQMLSLEDQGALPNLRTSC